MKVLVAIISCHAPKYKERAQSQRDTWIKDFAAFPDFHVHFFLGGPPAPADYQADEIELPVDDGYKSLPRKTQLMCAWALDQGYDFVFKTDDDVWINAENLTLRTPMPGQHYIGTFRGPSGGYPADYASGYAYWLDREGMQAVVESPMNGDWAEDRWLANSLAKKRICGWHDKLSYRAVYPPVLPVLLMRAGNRFCTALCEYPPAQMRELYRLTRRQRLTCASGSLARVPLVAGPQPAAPKDDMDYAKQNTVPSHDVAVSEPKKRPLENLSVLIKTFLRDGYLFDTLATLRAEYPEMHIIVADDGHPSPIKDNVYREIEQTGAMVIRMPFDSGFGAKANEAINYLRRPYLLIGSDDFNFRGSAVRAGIERMLTVMENVPELGAASGRVDGHPYEGFLEWGDDFIREIPVKMGNYKQAAGIDYIPVDLTVNYSILRASALTGGSGPPPVRWRDAFKIGGEHFFFFYDLKQAGWQTAFVPGVNIDTYRYDPKKCHQDYNKFRGRALKQCVTHFPRLWAQARGIPVPDKLLYYGFDGEGCDYVAEAKRLGVL